MAKFIDPKNFEGTDMVGFLVTPIPSKDFVLWDGKTFRKKDGSKFPNLPDEFSLDLPDNVPILGWISREGKELPGPKDIYRIWKEVSFLGFDIPEMVGTLEERIEFLEVLWYGCRNYHFKPANTLNEDQTKNHKKNIWIRRSGSKWKDHDWLFEK